jgi:hypothetical protein
MRWLSDTVVPQCGGHSAGKTHRPGSGDLGAFSANRCELVVQLKQMIPALPFSSPPRKRGSRAASLVPAGLEPALLRP